jgi:IclR family transcriptional regulator, KDG regulon repressor
MSTVARAIDLLDLFSPQQGELGLSEIRRKTGRDKATCYRHLCALEAAGLLEQNPVTKRYRIGPAVLRWAAIREATVPRRASAEGPLRDLAEATGELAHLSLIDGTRLQMLAQVDAGQHSTRVVLEDIHLPFHATASGLATLAFATPEAQIAGTAALPRYTARTIGDPDTLQTKLDQIRAIGFGVSDQGYELGVHGIAVPIFEGPGQIAGAVAVASVVGRMTFDLEQQIKHGLIVSGRQITANWGGTIPASLDNIWSEFSRTDAPRRNEELA